MPLSNYTELQASIAEWLENSDLGTQIPDFIRLVEAEVQTELDDPNQATSAPLTIVSGQGDLPADFGGLLSISNSTFGRMDQISASEFGDIRPSAGYPTVFAITNNKFSVAPSGSGTITLLYRKGIPPLASNATNWLLDRLPNVYLYGSLTHAGIHGWEDERLPDLNTAYEKMKRLLWIDGERRKFGAAPLAPRLRRT